MITKELIILAKAVNGLDSAALETLEKRITFQKKVYLLQASGLDLGYVFGWDLYGPYSSGLAVNATAYEENKDKVDNIILDLKLSDFAQKKIAQAKRLIAIPDGSSIKESAWLELISSLHYLAKFQFNTVLLQNDDTKVQQVNESLLGKKPHLREHESSIHAAWQCLWSCLN